MYELRKAFRLIDNGLVNDLQPVSVDRLSSEKEDIYEEEGEIFNKVKTISSLSYLILLMN